MSNEDQELDRLKAKRLEEMQRNISSKKNLSSDKTPQIDKKSPREILVSRLGYRGLEVLQNAELQFPDETKIVIEKLAELVTSGEISEILDGGKLLMLFRTIGLHIRMKTTINVEQEGKFVSLSDKLSKISTENDDEMD